MNPSTFQKRNRMDGTLKRKKNNGTRVRNSKVEHSKNEPSIRVTQYDVTLK